MLHKTPLLWSLSVDDASLVIGGSEPAEPDYDAFQNDCLIEGVVVGEDGMEDGYFFWNEGEDGYGGETGTWEIWQYDTETNTWTKIDAGEGGDENWLNEQCNDPVAYN